MENGSFQTRLQAQLPNHDIQDEELTSAMSHVRQNEAPPSQRISSLQSLMQQNEDISARLKITIQKMAKLEDNNDFLAETNRKLQNTIQALNDQLLIWKEKERLWQERFDKSEYKLAELKSSIPDASALEIELKRYQRYQERVRKQIKPYIQQLKIYSQSLKEHIQNLNTDIDRKEFEIKKFSEKANYFELEFNLLTRSHQLSIEELKNIQLSQMQALTRELHELRESHFVALQKNQMLDQALALQDDLTNQNIVLKRAFDELQDRQVNETEGLRQSLTHARSEIMQKDSLLNEYSTQLEKYKNESLKAESESNNLREQMTNIRLMWNEKSHDFEKMKMTNQALEKINLELSQKLTELREQV